MQADVEIAERSMASELRVRGIIPVGLLRVRYVSAQGLQDPDRGIRSTDAI